MIADLKPYPTMKDSGIEWLGKVPEHWTEKRAKYSYREVDERSSTGKEELMSVSHKTGVTPRKESVTMFMAESNVGHKICRPDDIAINTMWAFMGALGVASRVGLVSPSYGVYRPTRSKGLMPRYIDRLLRIDGYKAEYMCRSTGINSSRLRLYPDEFLRIPIVCPPLPEQVAIVRYLDHVDQRVRRLVRAKRKLIALLTEQKQAIIHQAVTRGLDPDVPLKDSGVEWLGQVPEHWEVRKLRFDFTYAKGSRAAEITNEYIGRNPGPHPVFSGQTENNGLMGSIGWHEFNFENDAILVTTVGARAMSTRLISGAFSLSQNCAIIVPRDNRTSTSYYEMVMRRLFAYEKASISLIMQPSLRFSDLNRFHIPVPSVLEQAAIFEFLNEATREIDTTISRAIEEIDLLNEYRTRLIADVVTGKLDVREAATALPEVDPLADDERDESLDSGPQDGLADLDATMEDAS